METYAWRGYNFKKKDLKIILYFVFGGNLKAEKGSSPPSPLRVLGSWPDSPVVEGLKRAGKRMHWPKRRTLFAAKKMDQTPENIKNPLHFLQFGEDVAQNFSPKSGETPLF